MDLIKELEQWEKDLNELGAEKAKAEGKYEQAMADLKALGYDSIGQAKLALEEMIAKREILEEEARQLLDTFKEKYAPFIESEA